MISQSNTKSELKFEMIQDYKQKFITLKTNQTKSQKLNKQLKEQLLRIGSESNTLLISIKSLSNRIAQLRSVIPQRQKQLYFTKQQLKRFQYKTEKAEIKLKEYQERGKKFDQMQQAKKQKNLTIKEKIERLENKIKEEKETSMKLTKELNLTEPKIELKDMQSLKVQSFYLKSLQKNPIDEMQLSILNSQMKTKKLKHEKDELQRKNAQIKSNITKIQLKIQQNKHFLSQSSLIPESSELTRTDNLKNSGKTTQRQISSELKKNSQQDSAKNLQSSRLPSHILSILPSFQNFKSKSIIQNLVQKHSQISSQQQQYVEHLQQTSSLMIELSKINSILESQIVQQNSRISSLNIKNKRFSEINKKSVT